MSAHANQRDRGPDRLKVVDHGEAYPVCAGIGRCQDCSVDFSGYDWKKLLFGLRRFFAAGPAGCVDWMVFMRGAAALAYLSLQHIKLRFDWVQK